MPILRTTTPGLSSYNIKPSRDNAGNTHRGDQFDLDGIEDKMMFPQIKVVNSGNDGNRFDSIESEGKS